MNAELQFEKIDGIVERLDEYLLERMEWMLYNIYDTFIEEFAIKQGD